MSANYCIRGKHMVEAGRDWFWSGKEWRKGIEASVIYPCRAAAELDFELADKRRTFVSNLAIEEAPAPLENTEKP